MRKILIFILAAASFLLTGCNKTSTEATTHAIAGHSFRLSIDDTHWEIISFAVNGTASCTTHQGETENTIEHLTYTVRGVDIEICRDYSDVWPETMKGSFFNMLFFLPEYDCIKSPNGYIYYRYQ